LIWESYSDGIRFKTESEILTMSCREIGALAIPSGRVVACDPFTEVHTRSFRKEVEPGNYAIFLAVATYLRNGDQRVASAMIQFDPETPSRWEFACKAKHADQSDRGFIVDSGRGCLIDSGLARFLYREAEHGKLERYQRRIEAEMDEKYLPTWAWANVKLDERPETNIVAFTTGLGDGTYPSYFGLDSAGRPLCLVTVFNLWDGADLLE
jgi:hypothetical protein